MTLKKIILLIILLVAAYFFLNRQHLVITEHNIVPTSSSLVVLVCMLPGAGGTERYTLAQQQEFIKLGVPCVMVCHPQGFVAQQCVALGLPHITCSHKRWQVGSWIVMPGIERALRRLQEKDVLAIHCSHRHEALVARKVVKNKVPVVLTMHMGGRLAQRYRNAVDAVVSVGREGAKEKSTWIPDQVRDDTLEKTTFATVPSQSSIKSEMVIMQSEHRSLALSSRPPSRDPVPLYSLIKSITLPPLFDAARITSFSQPSESRTTFFKNKFNITLKSCPLLTKIAHLYANVHHKNHPLLFNAMHELIVKRNIPVQVVLVGDGPMMATYQKMVRDLGIADYVHFLGNTELTPHILHYADINILTSSKEAFGIVLLEGGLMKKPTIVARGGCGAADWLIIDQKTGFLFDNNDVQSLANTIAYVLAHHDEATECGQRLYEKVVTEFMPAQTAHALMQLYHRLAKF